MGRMAGMIARSLASFTMPMVPVMLMPSSVASRRPYQSSNIKREKGCSKASAMELA